MKRSAPAPLERPGAWPTLGERIDMEERSFKGMGKGAHDRAKTHCPKGHPYSAENLIVNSRGHRKCLTCVRQRKLDTVNTGSYVAGWRDQACPICGARWFVNASTHVFYKHGIRMRGLTSEAYKINHQIMLAERVNGLNWSPKAAHRRHLRWLKAVEEEFAEGGKYTKRLAKRWRTTPAGTSNRIRILRKLGMLTTEPSQRLSDRDSCRKGHLLVPENTYVNPNGQRLCRICRRIRTSDWQRQKRLLRKQEKSAESGLP